MARELITWEEASAPWDGVEDIYAWRRKNEINMRRYQNQSTPMLQAIDAWGEPLYKLSDSGRIVRTKNFSKSRRKQAIKRDGHRCIDCGSEKNLEVDHIIRYVDGGGNDLSNLRTLCHPCHSKRGGRA